MAFITAETRSDLIELSVAMLKQAPSAALLEELIALSVGGGSLADAADHIAKTDAFKAEYPSFQTAEQYAAEIFDNITTGGTVTADIRTAVIELATGMLTSGSVTKAGLALAIAEYLAAPAALLNEDFADIAQSFQNRADAAEYFVVTKELGGSTAAELAASIASVTSDAATLTAANTAADATASAEAVVAGQTFTLTTGQDAKTLGEGADTISASLVGAGATGTTAQPGDSISGGAGSDKLSLSVSGDSGGAYSLQAVITDSVETLHVSNFETDAAAGATNTVTTIDGSLMVGLEEVGLSASSAEGDTKFDNVMNIVDVAMQNGSGDLQVAYASGVTTGTQTQNIALSNVAAGTLTIAGVENLNISSGVVKSTLTALTAAAMKSITVTGSTDLKITGALDFADDATGVAGAIDGTIDASNFTGKLTVTSAADEVSITGGSGNDTINMAATFNGYDVINGGDGTDTLTMDAAALSTQFAQTSNIEAVKFNATTAAVTADISKLSAGVTSLTLDLSDADDAGTLVASAITKADGFKINIARSAADGATDTGGDDGVTLAISDTTDSADDTVNLQLTNVGLLSADKGIRALDVSTYETVNITANTNALGTDSTNQIIGTTASVATSINVDGTGALNMAFTGSKVTTFDASGLAGALTLTAGTEKATYSMGGKSSTIVFGGNLNASDTVIGGAGTADVVTASVTGLTAATGALNISDVEYVLLTTGGANTIALAGTSGLSNLAVTDNKQTITGFDLATTTLHLGVTADASDTASEVDVTAADATGTEDTLNVIVNTTAGAATSIIDASAIENLSVTVGRETTGTNATATLDLTTFEGTGVSVGSGSLAAGATVTAGPIALGTLHKNTTALTSTNKAAVTASMANATTEVTFVGLGAGIQTITGGLRADTFTIGSTGAIAHVIEGGSGSDTTNMTVTTGLVDVSGINTEAVNLTVGASVDTTITGDFNAGVDNITITGGNSLSEFDAGTLDTAIQSINASAFLGQLIVDVAASALDSTLSISAGDLTTDKVTANLVTATTYVPKTTGVEILDLNLDDDITVNLSGTTGVSRVDVDIAAGKDATISNIVSETVRVTDVADNAATVVAVPVDATEADNSISFQLVDTGLAAGGASTIAVGTQLVTSDVETVSITSATANTVDLGGLTMTTATSTVTLNLFTSTTFAGITLSDTSAQTTTINAAGAYGVTQTGRSATTAVDYTGSAGNDTFIMMSKADSISGGAGTSDTLDVNYGSVLGGISVDLSATGEQISTMDGGAISGSVTGFENVDLSGYTGFGASVTAIKTGSTITGTGSIDRITGGAGADTITGGGGADVISGGAGADTFVLTDRTAIDTISDFTSASDKISLNGGAVAVTALDVASIDGTETLVLDTIANLGALGVTIGDQTGGSSVNYAVASDTGAIFFDADGDWTAGSVQIGTVGAVTLVSTDFVI
jgi:hypothetical protein